MAKKSVLGVVFLTVFIDLIGFGIIIPIQPFYAEKLGASPALITILGASFSLMQFLFAPLWGRTSDRIGRRPIMLVSIASTAVGYLLFGLSNTLLMLFFSRMLAGAGSANIGTAQAIIADSTTHENRAKGMGLIGAAFGLGFIFGPAIGGFFSRYGLNVPIFIAAGLSAVNFVLAFFIIPETLEKGAPAKVESHRGFSFKTIKDLARHTNVAQLFLISFLFTLGFSMMEQVLGLLIEKVWLPLDPASAGLTWELNAKRATELTTKVLVVVGVVATIIQGGLIGRLAKQFGERWLLVCGLIAAAVSLALMPEISHWIGFAGLLITGGILAVGSGLTNPSLSSLISRSVDRVEQGAALGCGQSLSALGRVVGPAISGMLFQMMPGIPFWLGSVIMVGCAVVGLSVAVRGRSPFAAPPVNAAR